MFQHILVPLDDSTRDEHALPIAARLARAIIRGVENGEDDEGAGAFGGCDVIAMATHGREGLQRSAMGSITERVLHATTLPLLIIRPRMAKHEGHVSEEQLIGTHL